MPDSNAARQVTSRTLISREMTFELPGADRAALAALPWERSLDDWPALGVQALHARRGESRHVVLFVEAVGRRYAVKETSPEVARGEISRLLEIRRRGLYALEPVGVVVAPGPPIAVGKVAGVTQYIAGDRGYCITRLAQRVIPQALLYRYPFTRRNRQMLWNAIVSLLLDLHDRGVFWGDPSLANILVDLSHHQVRALLADAETAELYAEPLEEMRRQEDLAALQESLLWTGEDIRMARGQESGPITEEDTIYIAHLYSALRRARTWGDAEPAVEEMTGAMLADEPEPSLEPSIPRRRALRLAGAGSAVRQASETMRPRWYQQRVEELLGVRLPRRFARQFYEHLTRHQWLMSERAGREIPAEEAARDWYERYHLPEITLLRTYFPTEADSLEVYLGVLDRKWELSLRAGVEISLEEAALDYALRHARSADLLHRAFAAVASLWPQRSELGQLLRPEHQETTAEGVEG